MTFKQDELSQTKIDKNQTTPLDEHCPSCLESLPVKVEECPNCGIMIANFKRVALEKRIKTTVGGVRHLNSLSIEGLEQQWKRVEAVYKDSELHHVFIQQCVKAKALSFAVQKYSERLKRDPSDEVAEMMTKRAARLAYEAMPTPKVQVKDPMAPHSMLLLKLLHFMMSGCLMGGTILIIFSFFLNQTYYFLGLGLFLSLSSLFSLFFLRKNFLESY